MNVLAVHIQVGDVSTSVSWPTAAPLPHVGDGFVWEEIQYEVSDVIWEYRITGRITTVLVSIFLEEPKP